MSKVTGIALGRNADGGLKLLATSVGEGSHAMLWHAFQFTGGEWSGWRRFGAPGGWTPYTTPAVIQNAVDGRLEVFVTAGDGSVWHRWQTAPGGGWSEWDSLGKPGEQPATTTPGLALLPDARLVAVVIAGGAVWQASQEQPGSSQNWSAWSSLDGPGNGRANALAITINADGRQELFVREVQGDVHTALWHRWRTGQDSDGWSDWASLGRPGGHQPGVPVVSSSLDGRIELFTVADEAVWHRSQETTSDSEDWAPWVSLGRTAGGFAEVGVGIDNTARVHVVATSRNSADLWTKWQSQPNDTDWAGWASLGSVAPGPVKGPTLALSMDGRMELFLRTPSTGGLHQISAMATGRWWPYAGRPWPQP